MLARASVIIYQRQVLKGYSHLWLQALHKQYGPVVRLAPNELSFIEPEVWKDVYGHRATTFVKTAEFYGPDAYGSPPGIMRADNVSHARQRKTVSHAFSDKALKDQEQLLKGFVRLLVDKLRGMAEAGLECNIVEWCKFSHTVQKATLIREDNFTTFDIMADLTFGESLNQLTESSYHPWVKAIFSYVKVVSISKVCRAWPGLSSLLQLMVSKDTKEKRKQHLAFSTESIDNCMARKSERPHIWTFVTQRGEKEGGLQPTELYSNGTLFMLAGTETTATELSGLTYLLLKNPEKMRRLTLELRASFSSFEDMTMTNLSQLEYLGACIEEGLRYYPPVPVGPARTTPRGGASVCGRWVPGGVCCLVREAIVQIANVYCADYCTMPDVLVTAFANKFQGTRQLCPRTILAGGSKSIRI